MRCLKKMFLNVEPIVTRTINVIDVIAVFIAFGIAGRIDFNAELYLSDDWHLYLWLLFIGMIFVLSIFYHSVVDLLKGENKND